MKMRWRPTKAKGRVGLENDRIRRLVWPRVLTREPAYACEGCGARNVTLQFAHLFGRPSTGAGLGEWAHSEYLTAKLCTIHDGEVGCHERIDRALDHDLARKVRRHALYRLQRACPVTEPLISPAEWELMRQANPGLPILSSEPPTERVVSFRTRVLVGTLDEARQLVAELEASGWTYDVELQKPRRAE